MNLVIVESPAKAKTINKYLGDNYVVLASYGHIRDLPSKNGSVNPDDNFKMEWEVDSFCFCWTFYYYEIHNLRNYIKDLDSHINKFLS